MSLQQFTDAEHAFVKDGGRSQEMSEVATAREERPYHLGTDGNLYLRSQNALVQALPQGFENSLVALGGAQVV
ncbi:hypothetical protein PMI16_00447 [Herbaspirillum sp. CF444]|uniref:hypothetical protein n=1 Tax=Herbaspirillum sp. CF444 TaxID=1144319 RepID=UPI0002726DF5|nr:hypothetical protein [Herbaspirillum sp. CF444]EJL94092.1 hypothetical protein PMI16_00447 [Herbaspirillum sp. CF444]